MGAWVEAAPLEPPACLVEAVCFWEPQVLLLWPNTSFRCLIIALALFQEVKTLGSISCMKNLAASLHSLKHSWKGKDTLAWIFFFFPWHRHFLLNLLSILSLHMWLFSFLHWWVWAGSWTQCSFWIPSKWRYSVILCGMQSKCWNPSHVPGGELNLLGYQWFNLVGFCDVTLTLQQVLQCHETRDIFPIPGSALSSGLIPLQCQDKSRGARGFLDARRP